VFVHGQAGERLTERVGRLGFLARELLEEIAPVLNDLEAGPRA
jgi:ADP-dependent NAD(P)H-hydrate dehydratase